MSRKSSGSQEGEITSEVLAPFVDEHGGERKRRLAVAPAFSVMLEPVEQAVPVAVQGATRVKVVVTSHLSGAPEGTLQLQMPAAWRAGPQIQRVSLLKRGHQPEFECSVFAA